MDPCSFFSVTIYWTGPIVYIVLYLYKKYSIPTVDLHNIGIYNDFVGLSPGAFGPPLRSRLIYSET